MIRLESSRICRQKAKREEIEMRNVRLSIPSNPVVLMRFISHVQNASTQCRGSVTKVLA